MKWAYYNEHDAFAAAWLRELMADGLIAPGEVDERSIVDVRADDLRGFRQVHLFAGVGIWSLALRRAGVPDDFGIWTGSCPCQPFSGAGKRKGTADERHLWPEMFRLGRECRPDLVVGEQVGSKDALAWFDALADDMEGAGYACGAVNTGAHSFGAPHQRQRLYWAAERLGDATIYGSGTLDGESREGARRESEARGSGIPHRMVDAILPRLEGHAGDGDGGHEPGRVGAVEAGSASAAGGSSGLADTIGSGVLPHGRSEDDGTSSPVQGIDGERERVGADSGECCAPGRLAYSDGRDTSPEGLQRGGEQRLEQEDGSAGWVGEPECERHHGSRNEGREAESGRGRLDASGHGEPRTGFPGPVNGLWGQADWLLCRDGKWRPVEPSALALADARPDGVSLAEGCGTYRTQTGEAVMYSPLSPKGRYRNRTTELRGAGNAINVAQAEEFIRALLRPTEQEKSA